MIVDGSNTIVHWDRGMLPPEKEENEVEELHSAAAENRATQYVISC